MVAGKAYALSDMTSNILLYSQLESEAVQVVPREIDLDGLLRDVIAFADVIQPGAVNEDMMTAQIGAMVPIAGPADEAWALAGCDLGLIPIWAFHGEADDVVPLSTASVPIESLSACPSPPRASVDFTVYSGVDHDS